MIAGESSGKEGDMDVQSGIGMISLLPPGAVALHKQAESVAGFI